MKRIMTIQEAIKTGKPIKQINDKYWINKPVIYGFLGSEIIAEDWEVREVGEYQFDLWKAESKSRIDYLDGRIKESDVVRLDPRITDLRIIVLTEALSIALEKLNYIANSVPGPNQAMENENKLVGQKALKEIDDTLRHTKEWKGSVAQLTRAEER
jgi:hypothetical protein